MLKQHNSTFEVYPIDIPLVKRSSNTLSDLVTQVWHYAHNSERVKP